MNTETSARLFEEALQYIPGGVNSPVRAMKGVGMPHPLFISRAERSHIWDADGNEFVDFVSSWGPMILGWGHPEVVGRLKEQVDRGTSYGAPTELEVELARLVCDAVPSVELVRMVNSGTEATMSAVRVARGFTGREKIVKFIGCYHGHSDGFLVAAGSGVLTLALPDSPGVTKGTTADTLLVEYNDVAGADRAVRGARRGDRRASSSSRSPATWASCRRSRVSSKACASCARANGAVLIFDEVITGFRVGLGRRAGALRRHARPHHARQDHRRRPARRRLRRPPRDHGDGGAARPDLPGRDAVREPAGDGRRRGHAAGALRAGRVRAARGRRRARRGEPARGRRLPRAGRSPSTGSVPC